MSGRDEYITPHCIVVDADELYTWSGERVCVINVILMLDATVIKSEVQSDTCVCGQRVSILYIAGKQNRGRFVCH